MKGKKVLILGDDVGVLSETLNVLGAEAVGIERDDYDVRIAHSGILAENGQPQKQVLQGDLWDIADESSTLFHQLKEKGPFDLVYSYAVYNDGSGFSESPKNNGTQELLIRYNINIEKLMKNNGLQIHEACEKMPGSYIAYGIDEGYFYLQWPVNQLKDEQASRSFSELKRILDDNCIPLFHRIYGVRGHLLTEISPMLKALRSRIEELKKSKE